MLLVAARPRASQKALRNDWASVPDVILKDGQLLAYVCQTQRHSKGLGLSKSKSEGVKHHADKTMCSKCLYVLKYAS